MKQALIILLAIIIGTFYPQISVFSFLITYLLGVMLFFSFLKADLSFKIFMEIKVYYVFLANICIGWLAYFLALSFGKEVAFIAFLVGMIPTALAAPAVVSVLKGNIEFTVACVVVTNFGMGLVFPLFASLISPKTVQVLEMLGSIILLLGIPFMGAQVIKQWFPLIRKKINSCSSVVFYLWGSIIIIAIAKSSAFLREYWEEYSAIIPLIVFITALICICNFTLGYFIGGKKYAQEASQSLGQKNPMLMIWIALEFFTPLAAIGPTFYIIFHNLINSWKMMNAEYKHKKLDRKNPS